MDHSEVRELLEDAAVEPHGLERLMAGDTPNAAVVAGHLAACPDCADELARLHAAVGLIGPVVRSVPPPELRQRTLAHIAAIGRPRGAAVAADPERQPAPASPAFVDAPALATPAPIRRRPSLVALAGLAAALIVAVGTGIVVTGARDAAAQRQAAEIEALGDVARWTLRVDGQPDARRVELAGTTSAGTSATLVYSPSSQELVIVADDLTPPPAGREYRCWVEVAGRREGIGRMFFGGDLAYWVGKVSEVSSVEPGVRFGVSLVNLDGTGGSSEPVLTGS